MTRAAVAVALLAAMPVRAEPPRALPVKSGTVLVGDAPLEVGPGVFLPEALAVERARELEACRAQPRGGADSRPPAPSAGGAFGAGVAVGVLLSVAAVVAVVLVLPR